MLELLWACRGSRWVSRKVTFAHRPWPMRKGNVKPSEQTRLPCRSLGLWVGRSRMGGDQGRLQRGSEHLGKEQGRLEKEESKTSSSLRWKKEGWLLNVIYPSRFSNTVNMVTCSCMLSLLHVFHCRLAPTLGCWWHRGSICPQSGKIQRS